MRVLITISDMDCARTAADFAVKHLETSENTEISVLAVVEEPELDRFIANVHGYLVPEELMSRISENLQTMVNDFSTELQNRAPLNVVAKEVVRGRAVDVITHKCEQWHPDAVVVVHHERPFHWHSTSREVARRVPCSVIVLNENAKTSAEAQDRAAILATSRWRS